MSLHARAFPQVKQMPNRDVTVEKSMEEILQKVQREFADEGKQEARTPAGPPPRSAEVLEINVAAGKPPSPAAEDAVPGASGNQAAIALAQLAALYTERRRYIEFPVGNAAGALGDIVREMLWPMLQGWLEEKLPEMIERLIKAELSRAIGEAA